MRTTTMDGMGAAVIGPGAVVVAVPLWRRLTPTVRLAAVGVERLEVFDALSAHLGELRFPWPEFLMLEVFGRSMSSPRRRSTWC